MGLKLIIAGRMAGTRCCHPVEKRLLLACLALFRRDMCIRCCIEVSYDSNNSQFNNSKMARTFAIMHVLDNGITKSQAIAVWDAGCHCYFLAVISHYHVLGSMSRSFVKCNLGSFIVAYRHLCQRGLLATYMMVNVSNVAGIPTASR